MQPQWLQERREKAVKVFNELPLPTKEEYWRRAGIDRIHLEKFIPLSPLKDGKNLAHALLPTDLKLAGEILCGENISPPILSPEATNAGVVLLPLAQALETDPEFVGKYLGRGLKNRQEKFLAQNDAYWQSGAFCKIPKNVKMDAPILIAESFSQSLKSSFTKILIVVEKGSEATILHYATSQCEQDTNYSNSVFEVYVEDGATLNLISCQALSQQTYEIALKRVELARDAKLHWVTDLQGAKLSKTNLETVLNGNGANAEVVGLICANKKQHLELFANTIHQTPHTTADILVKGTVSDQAKTIFQGMIRIDKPAQQTESFMQNNNLVLSNKAHADSIPRLEIEADDVKASHGATIGQVDAEQLFYLKSKGLTHKTAQQLLIQGFYEEVFLKIPSPAIQKILRLGLKAKGIDYDL